MMPVMELNPPAPQWREKIEMFASDDKAKNRLRDELLPIHSIYRRPKIDMRMVEGVVEQFSSEINKKSQYFGKSSLHAVIEPFVKVVVEVLQLNPAKVNVQVTSAPGIYIYAEIGNQNLHIDLNFNDGTGRFEEAVANIFSDKIQKLSVFGSVGEVTSEIQNYFEPRNASYEYFIQSLYAIPGQTYSPNLF